jgi:hypothetical protein
VPGKELRLMLICISLSHQHTVEAFSGAGFYRLGMLCVRFICRGSGNKI